ncbi:unnamed protein product [Rotaria sp. Silwood2]|nr:unnamed protein product [Rotaria sp. Silwood2]
MVTQRPTESVGQIPYRLSKKGIKTSETTLRRGFEDAGVQSMKPTSQPLLTNGHIKKRLQWAIKRKDVDWNQIVFTDESSFHMKHMIRRVWKKRGEKYYVSTIKHPVKVHLMCKIYQNGLLPSVKKWFGDNSNHWTLLEDNDPKHTSKTSKTFKTNNGMQSLPWPSQSPDCNPIENVWALMKLKINQQSPTSINNFIARIKKEWKNLSIEFAEKLVDSMKNRA